MTPKYDGHLFTVNLILHLFGIEVKVKGTVEALAIRKALT